MRATDFGQLLLLFSRANLERYEITYLGARLVAPVRMQTFRYKQLNGLEALTVFQGGQTQSLERGRRNLGAGIGRSPGARHIAGYR